MIAISNKYEVIAAAMSGGKITISVFDIPAGIERSIEFYFKKDEVENIFVEFCKNRKLI